MADGAGLPGARLDGMGCALCLAAMGLKAWGFLRDGLVFRRFDLIRTMDQALSKVGVKRRAHTQNYETETQNGKQSASNEESALSNFLCLCSQGWRRRAKSFFEHRKWTDVRTESHIRVYRPKTSIPAENGSREVLISQLEDC